MVLRKPYAFLIRNFKLIHFILAILMGVFFSKLRSIADFFKEYIEILNHLWVLKFKCVFILFVLKGTSLCELKPGLKAM